MVLVPVTLFDPYQVPECLDSGVITLKALSESA